MRETKKPKVSVLLPNLNNYPFLEERIQTILYQTFTNWELIVVDGYSDDGSWELIQNFLKKEPRMRISQSPRKGIYDAFNRCIQQACGEYIYIATSDDTMMPDCLEKMVNALDTHPECGICHCCLKVINEKGEEIPDWWHKMPVAQFYGDLMNKLHIRFAPYDGILYCAVYTIYHSFTQLLIRRSIFDEIGLCRTEWGSQGDNEWGMRATLLYNTIHIPETLATWRIHSNQATKTDNYTRSLFYANFREMIKSAFTTVSSSFQIQHPECYQKIKMHRLLYPYTQEYIKLSMRERPNRIQKLFFLLSFTLEEPKCMVEYIYRRVFRRLLKPRDFSYIQKELERLGLDKKVKVL